MSVFPAPRLPYVHQRARQPEGRIMSARFLFLFAAVSLASTGAGLAGCRDYPAPGVDWAGCDKPKLMLGGENLEGGNLVGAILAGSGFSDANLKQAKLDGTDLTRTTFKNSNLAMSSIVKAAGSKVNFTGANLSGAMMSKIEISRSEFIGAVLVNADMSKGEFSRCEFRDADLTGANLKLSNISRSGFTNSKLAGADLTSAYMYRSIITGVDLSAVNGLDQSQVDAACGDAATKLPAGLAPSANWPCEE